jgi:hypothetical protein
MRLSLGCHKASNARFMNRRSDETIASWGEKWPVAILFAPIQFFIADGLQLWGLPEQKRFEPATIADGLQKWPLPLQLAFAVLPRGVGHAERLVQKLCGVIYQDLALLNRLRQVATFEKVEACTVEGGPVEYDLYRG